MVEFITIAPTAMTTCSEIKNCILNWFLQSELSIQLIVQHENRIRLTSLFQIVYGIEQRHHLVHAAVIVRIILHVQGNLMSLSIPVADVSCNPDFALQTVCQCGYFCLIKYRIRPFLTWNNVMIVLTNTETSEEAHQFYRNIIIFCRNQTMVVFIA